MHFPIQPVQEGVAYDRINDKVYLTGIYGLKFFWDASHSYETPDGSGYDIFLTSFNGQTGAVLGIDSLKSSYGSSDYSTAIVSDNKGNIYVGGNFKYDLKVTPTSTITSAGGTSDFFIAKYGTANCGSIVPLQLLNFTAAWQGNKVACNCQTTNEINTQDFVVQRSTNGTSFEGIGTVLAKGGNDNTYSLLTGPPLGTKGYYRLLMRDKDGQYSYSKTVSITLNLKL